MNWNDLVAYAALLPGALLALMLFRIASSARTGPVYAITWVYFTFILFIPGLFQWSQELFYWADDAVTPRGVVLALLVTGLFLAGFELAYSHRLTWRNQLLRFPNPLRTIRPGLPRWLFVVSPVLALLITAAAIAKMGLSPYLSTRSAAMSSAGGGATNAALFLTIPRAVAATNLLFLLVAWRQVRDGLRVRPVTWSLLTVLPSLASLITLFPTALPRFVLLGTLLTWMLGLLRHRPGLLKASVCIAIPFGLFTVLPLLNTYNRGEELGAIEVESLSPVLPVGGDYDSFEWVVHTVQHVEAHGTVHGVNLLSAAFFFVPRSAFSAKLPPSGSLVAENLSLDFVNVSCPLPAECFLAFGWFGVFAGAWFLGTACRWLDASLRNTDASSTFAFLIACCVFGQLPILLRGSLLAVISILASQVAWIAFLRFATGSVPLPAPLRDPSWSLPTPFPPRP
jgi:hypothetical protein